FLAGKKGDALTGTAALWIETGALPPAAFSDLEARFRYADNLLHIESGRLQAYQGSVALSGTVAPLSKTWELRPVLENLSLEKLLQQLPEAKDNFAGLFSGAFVVKSPVEASAEALPLTTGTFRIDQGVIRNKNIMAAVLDSMFGLKGLAGLIDARAKKLNKYKYTKFDFMEGDFELENQIMQLKKLFIANIQTSKADGAEAEVSGTVRLTDKTLDLKGNLVLSPKHSARLTRRVKALKSLFNAQKRMVLPVRVSGPTEKPRFAVDTRYVMKAIGSYYAGRLLKKRSDDEKIDTRETVRQLLEGLLERR
ncbi:MAG: AsmA-like C-terminal region-containing protein, partial [Deltaproteobacteria bacterium]|nr:AsmA-like C-terminal region-containing protein [Deltaproteobacteria bacterium]